MARAESLTERRAEGPTPDRTYHGVVKRAKITAILDMLAECDHDTVLAAKRLGISLSYLHRVMRNLGIDT